MAAAWMSVIAFLLVVPRIEDFVRRRHQRRLPPRDPQTVRAALEFRSQHVRGVRP